MLQSIHIVCFGKDPQLLHTREAVLAREFRTTPVDTLVSLLRLSLDCTFEIAVLCHTLSETEYQQAITFLHSCCPRAGIVALTSSYSSSSRAGSDRTMRGLDGPEALLSSIRSTLVERNLIA